MSERHDCGGDAAAYALGALEPQEAEAFRRHIVECVVCRDELAEFERVVDELPLTAAQVPAPRSLRRRVRRELRRPQPAATGAPARRARPWVARPAVLAGGLAALALAAAGGVELATSGGGSPVRVISASIGDAQLRVVGGHGELVVRRLRAPRPGRIYELWIQRGRQAPTPSTLFSTTSSGTADIGVPGRLVDVRAVLVTEEPAGGTQAPTSQPVIVARLAS